MPNIMRCIFLVCYLIHCVNSNSSRLGYMQSNYENVSDCFWNTFKPCYLDCMSGKSDLLAESIEIYYKQTVSYYKCFCFNVEHNFIVSARSMPRNRNNNQNRLQRTISKTINYDIEMASY